MGTRRLMGRVIFPGDETEALTRAQIP